MAFPQIRGSALSSPQPLTSLRIRVSALSSPQPLTLAPQLATCPLSIAEQLCPKAPPAPRSEEALRQGRGGQPALMGFSAGLAASPPAQVHQKVKRFSFHPNSPIPYPHSLDRTAHPEAPHRTTGILLLPASRLLWLRAQRSIGPPVPGWGVSQVTS